jgi:hypothetical protein
VGPYIHTLFSALIGLSGSLFSLHGVEDNWVSHWRTGWDLEGSSRGLVDILSGYTPIRLGTRRKKLSLGSQCPLPKFRTTLNRIKVYIFTLHQHARFQSFTFTEGSDGNGKSKGKLHYVTCHWRYKWWCKVIVLAFWNSTLNEVGVQLQPLAAIPLVKRSGARHTGGQVVHRAGLESRGEETSPFTQRGSNSETSSW